MAEVIERLTDYGLGSHVCQDGEVRPLVLLTLSGLLRGVNGRPGVYHRRRHGKMPTGDLWTEDFLRNDMHLRPCTHVACWPVR